jgi:hypothetical protein
MPKPVIQPGDRPAQHSAIILQENIPKKIADTIVIVFGLIMTNAQFH